MTLDEARANIGNGVVYRPAHGPAEDGTITDVNDRFVFVHYAWSRIGIATDPGDLTLLARTADA